MKTIVIALTFLLLLSGTSFAEDACIKMGNTGIILSDVDDCKVGFAAFQRHAEWKFATIDNGGDEEDFNVGCWRTDGFLVYVQFDGRTTTSLASSVVDSELCPPPEARLKNKLWESEIKQCEDFDAPKTTARLACNRAMNLAERFEESDRRLARTLEGLSLQSEYPAEAEAFLQRSLEIIRSISVETTLH